VAYLDEPEPVRLVRGTRRDRPGLVELAPDPGYAVELIFPRPGRYHVSVNNPTDRPITTTLTQSIPLPGLELPATPLMLQPGQYVVIR
jgi:hypothetical protein